MKFIKMQGAGNDYIFFDCFENQIDDPAALSVRVSDRNFGIGGDGIVLILPSGKADARMRIFNADGSEAQMCGNAIRCVGKYLYEKGIAKKEFLEVETLAGIKKLSLNIENGKVITVKVDMGKAILDPEKIPVKMAGESVVNRPVEIGDSVYSITCVSMGNPHCVVFVNNVDTVNLAGIGKLFENNPIFPERVNTEFVQVLGRREIKMRVWERGSGETLACGTGACASVVASVLCGHCDKDEDIKVNLRGGNLIIRYTEDAVFMTGDAVEVFTGCVENL